MKSKIFFFCLVFTYSLLAQENEFIEKNITINHFVEGSLLLPQNESIKNIAIIIGGSGPTDRNGNQNFLQNNSLKKLAIALSKEGIASFRYDKRIVKQIRQGWVDPKLMFDDFVTDAKSTIEYFRNTKSFNKIYVIGHSQGSLVGMLAAKGKADGFISLAGAGRSIDEVILEQIEQTAPMFTKDAKKTIETLKTGKTTDEYPESLASIFKKDLQPFMMSWMRYDPQKIIKDLNMPILIINGTKDLQVPTQEAQLLNEASDNSELKLIQDMNHILFIIEGGRLENSKSYNETFRPLANELITTISAFINQR